MITIFTSIYKTIFPDQRITDENAIINLAYLPHFILVTVTNAIGSHSIITVISVQVIRMAVSVVTLSQTLNFMLRILYHL